MLTIILQGLLEPVPVVQISTDVSLWRGDAENWVVVDEQYRPVGLKRRGDIDSLEPLVIVTYSDNLAELWQQIRYKLAESSSSYCVLVDAAGKYLGLINPLQLLRYLAPQLQISTPEATWTAWSSVTALAILLEQLPLPLMLKSATGQVLAQNSAWMQIQPALRRSPSLLDSLVSQVQVNDRTWHLASFPLHLDDYDRQPLQLVLATDITEQQQIAKELVAKNIDLINLNRLKDEFLACISHELKTPLTAVLGLSGLLKEQSLGTLNARQSRYINLIHQSGKQLMSVVNDILDLTRIETGQLELVPEPVSIEQMCQRAYQQACQRLVPHRSEELGVELGRDRKFSLDIAPDLKFIVADELRLSQALSHLLSNALKFTDPDKELGLSVNCWQNWIAFTVWDQGIGIPLDKQHLIFQKFQQLENTMTRRYEGTGLGLVIAQRLAHLHGGDISFISQPGQGSKFTLLLPAGVNPSTCLSPPEPTGQLVLVVDAVPQSIEQLSSRLSSWGYQIIIARSGTEALTKARLFQPGLCLLNPLLPLLSGWDVLTLLKSNPKTQNIPVVVIATHAEKHQAYQSRADGFLGQPIDPEALRQYLPKLELSQDTISVLVLTGEDTSGSNIWGDLLAMAIDSRHSQCQLLEVSELEQAELLAQVWRPDVLLLNHHGIEDLSSYCQKLANYPSLAKMPIVTLDYESTTIANQCQGLSIFPCLAAEECLLNPQIDCAKSLMGVIRVASQNHKPKQPIDSKEPR